MLFTAHKTLFSELRKIRKQLVVMLIQIMRNVLVVTVAVLLFVADLCIGRSDDEIILGYRSQDKTIEQRISFHSSLWRTQVDDMMFIT